MIPQQKSARPWVTCHLIPAAGIAGLIKTSLSLYHKLLPPTINCERPNPELHLERTPFYLNTQTRPWIHAADHPRRAGMNSFGFGGINTHTILEEYVGPLMDRFDNPLPPPRSISYLSAFDQWDHWGWSVALERPARAFTHLRAHAKGFSLTGTGVATVLTPSLFPPGALVRVIQRAPVRRSKETLTADENGRLEIIVPLSTNTRRRTARVSMRVLSDS